MRPSLLALARRGLLVSVLVHGVAFAPLARAELLPGQTPLAPGALRGLLLDGVDLAQAPVAPGQPIPEPPGKGMMVTGWCVLGGGYVFTVLVGLALLGLGDDPTQVCTNCNQVGTLYMIPLVGPFIAIPDADGTDGKVVSALLGIVQVAGAALGTVGTILYHLRLQEYENAISGGAVSLGGAWWMDTGVGGSRGDAPMLYLGTRF
jgi:hypothetical protein